MKGGSAMEHIILLEGKLTPLKYQQFSKELKCVPKETQTEEIALVISSGGGDISHGLSAILELEKLRLPLRAKIYRAGSIAALAALIAPKREMVAHGEFWIHLGNTREIESCDISPDGKIPEKIVKVLQNYRAKTFEYLAKASPKLRNDDALWSKLMATNHLRLNAVQCLEYGIIEKIV